MHGKRVCVIHGGRGGAKPTHGRYSKSLPKDLEERYDYFKRDPEILSLKPEVALARTMLERFMSTFVDGQGISADLGGELRAWFDGIGRITERCDKILNGEKYSLTIQGFELLLKQVSEVITGALDEHISDKGTRKRVRDAIRGGFSALGGAGPGLADGG